MKTALILSYLGSRYHGWQRQKNAASIQQTIEEAIEKTCGQRVALSGAGRTDAGVHARCYVASCALDTGIPPDRLPAALNARLPRDIVISKALLLPDDFDARFSCKRKEYTYVIHNAATRDPFLQDRAYFYPQTLDVSAMDEAAGYFVGRHDFAAVKSEGTPVKSTVRTIAYCNVTRRGDCIDIRVCADGFLYNMVRAITGTLIYCGVGKLAPRDIADILRGGQRSDAGPTAPPQGLYMSDLCYDLEELDGAIGAQTGQRHKV